jgi:hypothetical protein
LTTDPVIKTRHRRGLSATSEEDIMIIPKSVILAKLRERGLGVRADWVDKELPDEVDTFLFTGLLSTLNLNLDELAADAKL